MQYLSFNIKENSKFASSNKIQIVKKLLYIFIALLILGSCQSRFQKLLTGTDYNLKYETALKYYQEEEYYKAQQLFEGIITIYRGTDKSENIVYHLAQCYLKQDDYMYAGYYFDHFTTNFPTSEKLEECMYYTAYCYYKESPKYSLDQEYTNKALEEFTHFKSKFPESDKVVEVNNYETELTLKLQKKAYENAILYEKTGNYKAAIIALKNCIYDYPSIEQRETILYLILKSSYELANKSVASKKYERHESVLDEYFSYVDEFPNGKYSKEAEKMFISSKNYIDQF